MIIECVVSDRYTNFQVTSIWEHSPDDPWVINLSFVDQAAKWAISLDLVEEVITGSSDVIHGYGDVQVQVSGDFLLLHLDNGRESCVIKFPASEVEEFLNQVDSDVSEEIVSQKLDEFLGAL